MPRRLPDDPIAALEALSPDDLRSASSDLASNDAHIAEAQDLALDHYRDIDLDFALALAVDLDSARDLGLDFALALALAVDLDRALDRALGRALDRDLDRDLDFALALALDLDFALAVDLDRARDRALDLDRARALGPVLDKAFARQRSSSVQRFLEARASDLGVSTKALWASLLIQRWWRLLVVVWAGSIDEPDVRNQAFSQGEADRARGQLEATERSWQNIELDPQIELDPGDEAFIHAQLTTIRTQLIHGGIPEIIDRALAGLYERFADRADHEEIIRAQLAGREPPWADDEIDWLIGEYQRASDLVAGVSTGDDQAAGNAHNEIKETLGAAIPPPKPGDRRVTADPAGGDRADPQTGPLSKKVGETVLVGTSGALAKETVGAVFDFVASQSGSPWFRGLWEIIKALGKNWPFPM